MCEIKISLLKIMEQKLKSLHNDPGRLVITGATLPPPSSNNLFSDPRQMLPCVAAASSSIVKMLWTLVSSSSSKKCRHVPHSPRPKAGQEEVPISGNKEGVWTAVGAAVYGCEMSPVSR